VPAMPVRGIGNSNLEIGDGFSLGGGCHFAPIINGLTTQKAELPLEESAFWRTSCAPSDGHATEWMAYPERSMH
jgi:hypothetical protein